MPRKFQRPTPAQTQAWAKTLSIYMILMGVFTLGLFVFFDHYSLNRPLSYADEREHFKYGSIGADTVSGLPLEVIKVLPRIFPEYLPEGEPRDYTAFGFIQEHFRKMPIGFSTRRRFIDFAGLNCAVCHTGTVRRTAKAKPEIILGMPANSVDLEAYFGFLFRCAADWRFTPEYLIPEMEKNGALGVLDQVVYRLVIPLMQGALLARKEKVAFLYAEGHTRSGPGRVDTFDTFKTDQHARYYQGTVIPDREMLGVVDFPSIWNQQAREGMQLHWDGNNSSVRERNFNASFGAGATPDSVDSPRVFRIEQWTRYQLKAPPYPFSVDSAKARRGQEIYRKYCYDCHDFNGAQVGKVVPLEEIGTDPYRLYSFTQKLLEAQNAYTDGYPFAYRHFKKTNGYANHPLDGIWARAPYLHNGSVPTLWDLLSPSRNRPQRFYRGNDVYDPVKAGFVSTMPKSNGRKFYLFDTHLAANSNAGHSGGTYGTELADQDKWALIEYLKTERINPNEASDG